MRPCCEGSELCRKAPVRVLSRWLLGLGIAATLAAEVAH
jgi:hypothetical protein